MASLEGRVPEIGAISAATVLPVPVIAVLPVIGGVGIRGRLGEGGFHQFEAAPGLAWR